MTPLELVFHSESCGELRLINYVALDEAGLVALLAMRNAPQVREWMYNREEIALEAHLGFVAKLKGAHDTCYFLVLREQDVLGSINFKQINSETQSADIGLFANPNTKIKGRGDCLLEAIEYLAKEHLDLASLRLEVLQRNQRAVRLYQRNGYEQSGESYMAGESVLRMHKDLTVKTSEGLA